MIATEIMTLPLLSIAAILEIVFLYGKEDDNKVVGSNQVIIQNN